MKIFHARKQGNEKRKPNGIIYRGNLFTEISDLKSEQDAWKRKAVGYD